MKAKIYTLAALFILIGFSSSAQRLKKPQIMDQGTTVIKLNPWLFNHFQVFVEQGLTARKSAVVSLGYSRNRFNVDVLSNWTSYDENISSGKFFAYGELRNYKNKARKGHAAPIGRYNGVYTQLASARQTVNVDELSSINYDHKRNRSSLKLGVMTGKQWAMGQRMTFDLWGGVHGGLHFASNFDFENSNVDRIDYIQDVRDGRDFSTVRVGLRAGMAVGYRF